MQISNAEPISSQTEANQKSFKTHESFLINYARVKDLCLGLKPFTLPFRDIQGRVIQLWKSVQYGLVGGVLNPRGEVVIIPSSKISNPLNPNENSKALIHRLQSSPLKKWDLVFNTHLCSLTIWPHLEAEGRIYFGKSYQETMRDAQRRFDSMQTKAALNPKHYHAAQREAKGDVIKINSKDNEPFDHGEDVWQSQKAAKNLIKDVKDRLKKTDLEPQERKNLEKVIADTSRLIKESRKYAPLVNKLANPAQKNFEQSLQQKKLTESYNGTHRNNPVQAKGGTGGDIGGVACSTAYIEGLFDAPETLFERDHCFCLPMSPDGQIPFSDSELRQILREIAIGVYTHSTVPFFSLHFNTNSDLFPIIHPVYENTLVGRVISMLDYIMKGYLRECLQNHFSTKIARRLVFNIPR